jgi:hypothetical protein
MFGWPRPLPSAAAGNHFKHAGSQTGCGRYPSRVWLTTLWHLAFGLNLLSSLHGLTLACDDALS